MSTWVEDSHEWEVSEPELVIAGRTRWVHRVIARWRSRHFDRILADGACPEDSPALALRASRLTRLPRRRAMAQTLRQLVGDARDGTRPSPARIIPSPARIIAAAAELEALADALADPRPVDPHGVARAWLLLTDGTGPLYGPARTSLIGSAVAALNELELDPR